MVSDTKASLIKDKLKYSNLKILIPLFFKVKYKAQVIKVSVKSQLNEVAIYPHLITVKKLAQTLNTAPHVTILSKSLSIFKLSMIWIPKILLNASIKGMNAKIRNTFTAGANFPPYNNNKAPAPPAPPDHHHEFMTGGNIYGVGWFAQK